MDRQNRTAVIIGAGKGVGRALSLELAKKYDRTVAIARTASDLASLKTKAPEIEILETDASRPGVAADLIATHNPDLIAIVGGVRPPMGPISSLDWDTYSAAWNVDTKMTFHWTQAAMNAPLRPGSSVFTFSSGAALSGSQLSGGYAPAKKAQHFIMDYAQAEADRRDLGLTFATIYPSQLIAGTEIAKEAATAYGTMRGKTAEDFMAQWDVPLTPAAIAEHVSRLAAKPRHGAFKIDGKGVIELA